MGSPAVPVLAGPSNSRGQLRTDSQRLTEGGGSCSSQAAVLTLFDLPLQGHE